MKKVWLVDLPSERAYRRISQWNKSINDGDRKKGVRYKLGKAQEKKDRKGNYYLGIYLIDPTLKGRVREGFDRLMVQIKASLKALFVT